MERELARRAGDSRIAYVKKKAGVKKATGRKRAKKKTAKWKRSSPELAERFAKALTKLPDEEVEHRKMFGYPSGFVNGNLFAGLHEENCIVRLDEQDRDAALSRHGAEHFEPMGRRMREYVSLPPELNTNQRKLNNWVAKAFDYTASLPRKVKKAKKSK